MPNILVIAELGPDGVRKSTLSAITAARTALRTLSGNLGLLVLGHRVAEHLSVLAQFGAERLIVCDHPTLTHYTAEHFAPTVAKVALGFDLVLAAASSFGKDLVPRVAARLGAAYAGDCSGILVEDNQLVFERPMFAGNVLGSCRLLTPIQTATVRQSEFAAAERLRSGPPSPIEAVPLAAPSQAAARVQFVSKAEFKSERPELTEAEIVVAGGRPLKEKFFELLAPLADEMGAAIGATRAACDGGYAPGNCQVGQTGKVVAPDLYVAVGVSGALQHVAGMRKSRVVVAINRDPEAPILGVADYSLVADLFEAVPVLTQGLRQLRSGHNRAGAVDAAFVPPAT